MRRMTWGVAAVAAAVAGLGLVVCGDDSGSSSASTAPSASAAPETSASAGSGGTLTVTASEPSEGKYAFDVPAEIQGGADRGQLKNTGAEPHELGFVKVADGTTARAVRRPGADSRRWCPDPRLRCWVRRAGWRRHRPRRDEHVDAQPREGTYVYFCTFADDPSHFQNGMLGRVHGEGRRLEQRCPARDRPRASSRPSTSSTSPA